LSKYRSGFEERIAKAFTRRKLAFTYESTTLKYETPPVPAKTHKYTPDFLFEAKDGHTIYVEAKGYLKPHDRKKMKLVKKNNPDLDIRFLFMDGRRPLVTKRRRGTAKDGTKFKSKTYGEWAEQNGFKWAAGSDSTTVGKILKRWYDE
jgi:hypothetical protein